MKGSQVRQVLVLLSNIRLSCKGLQGTNTLDYLARSLSDKEKRFYDNASRCPTSGGTWRSSWCRRRWTRSSFRSISRTVQPSTFLVKLLKRWFTYPTDPSSSMEERVFSILVHHWKLYQFHTIDITYRKSVLVHYWNNISSDIRRRNLIRRQAQNIFFCK
jgi:hypothetical protein